MRLKTLLLNNIYSFGEGTQCTFEYIGASVRTLITGRNHDDPGADSNGAGKSNILNSIYWILFGEVFQDENVDAIIRLGQSWCSGTLEMVDGNNVMSISRGRGNGKRKFLKLEYNGENKTANTDEQTQAEILKYLQISNKLKAAEYTNDFVNTTYFSSDVVKGFMGKKTTSKERFQLVERFLNLKRYSYASELAKKKKTEIQGRADIIGQTLASKEQYVANNQEFVIVGEINTAQASVLEIQKQMLDISAQVIANNDRRMLKETLAQKQIMLNSVRQSFETQFTALENELEQNKKQQADLTLAVDVYNQTATNTDTKVQKAAMASQARNLILAQLPVVNQQILTHNTASATASAEMVGIGSQLANHLKCPHCATSLMYSAGTLQHVNIEALSLRMAELEQLNGQTTVEINTLRNTQQQLQREADGHLAVIKEAEAATSSLSSMRKPQVINDEILKLVNRANKIVEDYNELGQQAAAQVKDLKAQVQELDNQIIAMGESVFDVAKGEQELRTLREREAQVNRQLGQYEEQLRRLEQTKKEITEIQKELAEEQRQAEIYGFWEIGFRQIKLDIIDQFLPDFETLVNNYLERLKVSLRITFDTQKEKVNVSKKDRAEGRAFKEEFNVEVFKEGQEPLPYGLMSKGQRGRIGSCVGMALRELTKERGNNVFDFFFMDEIADALDESGLRELVSLLDELPGQKLIISHNDFLKDLFENTIVVEIEHDVSTIKAVA
jgi:DNA repair exonuclease SbcCD ATPase subunit